MAKKDIVKLVSTPMAAMDMLVDKYKQVIEDPGEGSSNVRAVLLEYVELFDARGLNGVEVVHSKIEMLGRKAGKDKKTINYLIGCLRNAVENGVSSTGKMVETRLINAFQNAYNIQLTTDGKEKILSMMTKFGTSEIVLTILENQVNMESIILAGFESIMLSKSDHITYKNS